MYYAPSGVTRPEVPDTRSDSAPTISISRVRYTSGGPQYSFIHGVRTVHLGRDQSGREHLHIMVKLFLLGGGALGHAVLDSLAKYPELSFDGVMVIDKRVPEFAIADANTDQNSSFK